MIISAFNVIWGQASNQSKIVDSRSTTTKAKLNFNGYQDEANKSAIRSRSDGCCGYCGIRITSSTTETVEHYRPKAELRFKDNYLAINGLNLDESLRSSLRISNTVFCDYGYFLWGDDCHNLLPSCECCNSGRGHNGIFITNSLNSDPGNIEYLIPYGKKNFFPVWLKRKGILYDERVGAEFINDSANEFPLLFNPYLDEPEDLFTYKEPIISVQAKTLIIKIRPKKGLSKKNKVKAQVSINLLGLNRQFLCIERATIYSALESIECEIAEFVNDNELDIGKWSQNVIRLSSYFNKDASQLLGFTISKFGELIDIAHSEINSRFVNQAGTILNRNSSFEGKVSELFLFGSHYKASGSTRDRNRRLLSAI